MIWDERIDEALRNHDAYENGKDEGYYSGKSDGIEQIKREMIINMYNKKISLETISEIANISKEEIENITNDIK